MARATREHIDSALSALDDVALATSDDVRSSWHRSGKIYRVDPASDHAPQILTAAEIERAREPAERMQYVARAELDRLYKLIRPTNYVILLCDNQGVVIEHRGEESEADQFRYWGTWLGGVWSENIEGTNGIGTCLIDQKPVTIHRSQHFRARHIALSCSGAPIYDPSGQLVGVLDVSSIDPNLSEHAHALTGPLTTSFALAIEERLFRDCYRGSWIVAIRLPDDTGGIMLFAVDEDQRILAADKTARDVLRSLGHTFAKGMTLNEIFKRNPRLFHRSSDELFGWLQLCDGVEAWPAIVTPPTAAALRFNSFYGDLHLRPRRDQLLEQLPHPPEMTITRGGLSPSALRRVRTYIDHHLAQNVDIKTLAAVAELSPSYFARAFKESQGASPHDYLLSCRLAKAKLLLQNKDLSLAQIASASGFSDQSHFTRRFRDAVGMAPGQFRKATE